MEELGRIGFGWASGIDRQRLFAALILSATALFLVAVAPGFPYRRVARRLAIAGYAITVAVVLVWVVLWLLGMAS